MRKFTILLALMAFLGLNAVLAQKTITGTVTSAEDGQAIPGVQVVVKGTTIGTTSDLDGNYNLTVNDEAETIVFKFVGMVTKEVAIGDKSVINVALEPEVMDIEGVVVTALGISRDKKTLGYAVQDVSGDELSKTNETNVVSSLSGKVAGVQITNASGAVGSSARITIRGNSSFGDNQPLFVVDGTPISNASSNVSQWGAVDFGNAAMDIAPENIESVSVLKGANAAALYGSRAANGVILITTKDGSKAQKGFGVSYSFTNDYSNIYVLPDYQDQYGQGINGSEYIAQNFFDVNTDNLSDYNEFAVNNAFSYHDGVGGGVWDYVDESWGPRLDIGLEIPQFNSPWLDQDGNVTTDPAQFASYQATPWVSNPDNVENFFETGVSTKHNVAITAAGETASARLSITNSTNEGTIPNTDLSKTSVNFNGTMEMNEKLSATVNGTYTKNTSDNLPGQGYSSSNVMQSIGSWFGRQVDMDALEQNYDAMDPFGKPYTWSYYYHNNPYWTTYKNTTSRDRDRIFGNVNLKYELADWISLNARAGTDYYYEMRKDLTYNMSNSNKTNGGDFWQNKRTNQETNVDVFAQFDRQVNDAVRIDGALGANYRRYDYNYSLLQANELTVPNLFTISNAKGAPTTDMYMEEKETNSVYGQINASYNDYLFLGATFRNDWSSTLPADEWSFFYPSVSVGFIFTDAFEIDNTLFSYGKLRASWAKVGNDTDPYQLGSVYEAQTNAVDGVSQYYYNRALPNAALKPENTVSTEIGAELKFWENRLGLDLTYYDKVTSDQIMPIDISPASGFTSRWINAGEIQNTGVELQLYADILKSNDGLNWTVDVNWSANENTVNELYGDLEAYQISSSWGGVTIEARPGEAFGVIKGTGYLRDDNGNIIVEGGVPQPTADPIELGNITPDWVGGVRNTFSYKNVNLSVLLDGRKGGDIFTVTKMFGLYAGILDETAENDVRVDGVIAGQNWNTDETFVNADGTPNETEVYAQSFFSNFYSIKEESVIDGSFIKLREITLGYTLPQSIVKQTGFLQTVTLSAYARNVALLWTHESNDVTIDPETAFGATNAGMGLEQYQLPPARTIGFKVNVKF